MSTATLPKNKLGAESKFDWPLCYEAENFILQRIDAFLERNSFALRLATRMRDEAGTLILDWTDHLLLPASDEKAVRDLGFADDPLGENAGGDKALWHPEAMLPRLLIAPSNAKSELGTGGGVACGLGRGVVCGAGRGGTVRGRGSAGGVTVP